MQVPRVLASLKDTGGQTEKAAARPVKKLKCRFESDYVDLYRPVEKNTTALKWPTELSSKLQTKYIAAPEAASWPSFLPCSCLFRFAFACLALGITQGRKATTLGQL